MRKWLPVFVVFMLMVTGIWFWSIGEIPQEKIMLAKIESITGDVTRKPAGSSDPIIGKIGDELSVGDVVETGSNGTAVIQWLDRGESRLSTSTRIQIDGLSQDQNDAIDLRLRLETGRIWMRVQSLLDLESTVSMQTSDVVATVRGTSFDLSKPEGKETTIWVSDSVVEANTSSTIDQPGLLIVEGSMAKFSETKNATSTNLISASGKESNWFLENKKADTAFDEKQRQNMRRFFGLEKQKKGPLGWLVDASQGMRGPEAKSRMLLRRVANIIELATSGAEGKAAEDFSKLERYVKTQIDSGNQDMKIAAHRALLKSRQLFEDILPNSPAYRYKQALEEWRIRLARNEVQQIAARMLAINDRIEEGRMALEMRQNDLAIQLADIANQSLENISRELQDMTLPERASKIANARLKALQARASALASDAKAIIGPTLPNIPTSTTMQLDIAL